MKDCLYCRYSYIEDSDHNLCCRRRKGDLCPEIVKIFKTEGKEKIVLKNYPACDKWTPEYKEGEAVIYQNGNRFELGIVKSVCENGEYFINRHLGDFAIRVYEEDLHKIANHCAFHVIRLDPNYNERR